MAYGIEGWQLKKWYKFNKDNLRNLIVLLTGYSYLVGFDWKVFLIAVGAILGKMFLDTADYILSE